MGVTWTPSARADFRALTPDEQEIDLVARTLDELSTRRQMGLQSEVRIPFAGPEEKDFVVTRVGRFVFVYQPQADDIVIVAAKESLDVPLHVLICDGDGTTQAALADALSRKHGVTIVSSIRRPPAAMGAAHQLLQEVNTVFIDPLSAGLEEASAFIFEIRASFPKISVVLYLDAAQVEQKRKEFYRGERSTFSQYRTLDKKTHSAIFQEELGSVLENCRRELAWRRSEANVKKALQKAVEMASEIPVPSLPANLFKNASDGLAELTQQARIARAEPRKNSIFLSHRFADRERINSFIRLLREKGFTVITGNYANSYINQAILKRIKDCEFFLCLMTRDEKKENGKYTTSPWVLEEKGAAIALRKRLVLMVEEGVDGIGGLHGDWQRISFTADRFLDAAFEALDQLTSYAGGPDEEQYGFQPSG